MPTLYLQTSNNWQRYIIANTANSDELSRREITIEPGCTIHDECAIGNGITISSGSVIEGNYLLLRYRPDNNAVLVHIGGLGFPITCVGGGTVSIGFKAKPVHEWQSQPILLPVYKRQVEAIETLFTLNLHWQDTSSLIQGEAAQIHWFSHKEIGSFYTLKGYNTTGFFCA